MGKAADDYLNKALKEFEDEPADVPREDPGAESASEAYMRKALSEFEQPEPQISNEPSVPNELTPLEKKIGEGYDYLSSLFKNIKPIKDYIPEFKDTIPEDAKQVIQDGPMEWRIPLNSHEGETIADAEASIDRQRESILQKTNQPTLEEADKYIVQKKIEDEARDFIKPEERMELSDSKVGRIFQTLGQPQNMLFSTAAGALDPKRDAATQFIQSYDKRRESDVQDVFNAAIERYTKDKDGNITNPALYDFLRDQSLYPDAFDIGDVSTFFRNLPVALIADPLNLLGKVTKGIEALRKVPKGVRSLNSKTLKGIANADLGGLTASQVDVIKQAQKALQTRKMVGGAVAGGMLSSAMSDRDVTVITPQERDNMAAEFRAQGLGEETIQRLLAEREDHAGGMVSVMADVAKAAATAGATLLALGPGLKFAKKSLKSGADGVYDSYLAARGVTAEQIARRRPDIELLRKTKGREQVVAFDLAQERLKDIVELDGKEKKMVDDIFNDQMALFIEQRNSALGNSQEFTAYDMNIRMNDDLLGAKNPQEMAAVFGSWKARIEQIKHPYVKNYLEQAINGASALNRKDLYQYQKDLIGERSVVWNTVTDAINKKMTSPEYLDSVMASQGDNVSGAINELLDNNKKFVETVNRDIYGLPDGQWKIEEAAESTNQVPRGVTDNVLPDVPMSQVHKDFGGKAETTAKTSVGLPGIAWHNANPGYKRGVTESLIQADKFRKGIKGFSAKMRPDLTDEAAALNPDLRYMLYAEETAKIFRTKEEREAIKNLIEIRQQLDKEPVTAAGRWALKTVETFDAATTRLKGVMLGESLSWLKNNYFDNIAKAMHTSGLAGVLDAGIVGKMSGDLSKDLLNLASKDAYRKLVKDPVTKHLVEQQIINVNFFDKEADDIIEFMLPKGDQRKKGFAPIMGLLKAHEMTAGKVEQITFKFGGYMEDMAKAHTFKRVFESMKHLNLPEKQMAEAAAAVVRDTFTDYSRVHDVEKAVARQIAPFWTYYTRNAAYWADVATTPDGQRRMRALNNAWKQIGRSPTEEEQESIPRYQQREQRVVGGGLGQEMKSIAIPNASVLDAFSTGDPEEARQKANPMLKSLYELVSGNDVFMGGKYLPSDLVYETKDGATQGRRSGGQRGYTRAWLDKQADDMGLPEGIRKALGTYGYTVDPESGKSYGTDDTAIQANKAFWDLITPPAVNQLGAPAVQYNMGNDEDALRSLFNLIAPVRLDRLTPEQQESTKRFKDKR